VSVKRGLGRGLGALLGEEQRPAPGGLTQIPVGAILPNPQQPRTHFDPAALAELEQSIRELGVLVPIIVRPVSGDGPARFELIAGERRWRAAAAARLETIPAIVRSADDRASLELAVVENLQREDLGPLEEAMGLAHLLEEYAFTQESLAERIGKSRSVIANSLRLLGLSDSIKARLRSGALSAGHARALLGVDARERESLAARIERDGLTVRDVERFGARRNARRTPSPAPPRKNPDLEAVETRLRYRLGAHVAIVPGSGDGGRIEIRYSDQSELTRLIDTIVPEGA
jgi:ParB family chromosome partitioning protein